MVKYKVLESEKENEVLIEKSGSTHQFTVEAVKKHMAELDRIEKELTAQIELEEAKMKNVETHHEIVQQLDDLRLTAIAVYAQSKGVKDKCEKKLKEVKEAKAEYHEEIEEIKKQTGVEI